MGLLRDTAAVLIVVCERRDLDGLVFTPTHFHLARLARPMGIFAEPAFQARMLALHHAVRSLRLDEAAQAVENGLVVDEKTGEPARWEPSPMIIPVAPVLREYFGSKEFEDKVDAVRRGIHFRLTPG